MKRIFAHLVALIAWTAFADALNTYTFKEPFNGAIYWDGKNTSGSKIANAGWTGGDPSNRWYPQPKENADIIFDDSSRGYRASGYDVNLYIYGYGGVTYPLIFNSVGQIVDRVLKPGGVYLYGRNTETYRDTFTVGAGGMTFYFPLTFANDFDVKLAASQPFYVTRENCVRDESVAFNASLVASESTLWTVAGRFRMQFAGGQSTNFHGAVRANNAFLFNGMSQHQRIFSRKTTLSSEKIDNLKAFPQFIWNFAKASGQTVITTPIEFDLQRLGTIPNSRNDNGTVKSYELAIPFVAMATTDADQDFSVRFEAPVTGVISNRCLLLGESTGNVGGAVTRLNLAGLCRSDQQRMVFAADNSGLRALGPRNQEVYVPGKFKTTDPAHMVYVNTVVSLAHPHAFGANNSEFNFEFRYGGDKNIADGALYENNIGSDGQKMHVILGLVATNGVDVGAGLYIQGNMQSGGNDLYGRGASILLGTDGPGESVFSGPIGRAATYSGSSYTSTPELRFQGGKGGSAVFTGAVSTYSMASVIGEGDVVFSNSGNKFASDPYGVRVRSGRLVITDPNAINHTGGGVKQEVLVGDFVPRTETARVYHGGLWTLADVGGTAPKYYSDWKNGRTNNLLEFATMPTIDGVTLEVGDRVVQSAIYGSVAGVGEGTTTCGSHSGTAADPMTYQEALVFKTNATDMVTVNGWVTNKVPSAQYINGIWEVVDSKHWRRVSWLDEDSEVLSGYGIRVHVTDGRKFGGRTFFLANREDLSYEIQNNSLRKDCGFHFGPCWSYNTGGNGQCSWYAYKNMWLLFQDEPSANPNASFLLKGAFDYAKKVVVTDNKSSGDSEIGGLAEGVTNVFTGIVRVEKSAVCLTSATNSLVMFTTLSNAVGVASTIVKTGAGTVALTNANLKLTMDGGLTLRAGTLVVSTNFYGLRGGVGQPPIAYQLVNRASGTLEVAAGAGEVDLVTGRTFNLSSFENLRFDRDVANLEVVLLRNTDGGELIGTPTVTGLGDDTYWRIHLRKNELVASYVKRGTFIIVR